MGNTLKATILAGAVAGGAIVFMVAQSTEQCRTFNTTSWSQSQKNHLRGVAVQVLWDAGHEVAATLQGDDTVCAVLPDSVDIDAILTPQAMLAKWNDLVAAWEAATAAAAELEAAREAEREANAYCQKGIDDIMDTIDQLYADATTDGQVKALSKQIDKATVRCMWAHRR